MSLFVTFDTKEEIEMHVGEKIHAFTFLDEAEIIQRITEVQADGDELELISSWKNLPNTGKRVQRWHGDHAKFIVGNWSMNL